MVDFGFLSIGKKERAVLDGAENHLKVVLSTVDAFMRLVDSVARKDDSSANLAFTEVLKQETEADTLQRDLSLKIAEGAFFGGVREDMLTLLEKIDNIADSAKDASRLLVLQGGLDAGAIRILGSASMRAFVSNVRSAVEALGSLLSSFRAGKKAALPKVQVVEEMEEAADSSKDNLLKELFGGAASMDPLSIIQMRDFIFVTDDIADNAEDASDEVLVLLAKGYG